MNVDKLLVINRFTKSIATYDKEASVQHNIAAHLAALVRRYVGEECGRVLEIGAGTGSLTRRIVGSVRCREYVVNDICEDMRRCLGAIQSPVELSFMMGDAESLQLPSGLDLILSSSAVQWFDSPVGFLERAHGALAEGGYVALSTFGTDNMSQVRDVTGEGLDYLAVEEWGRMLSEGFELLHIEQQHEELYFDSPKDVLRHLKLTGVTGNSRKQWTRGDLRDFDRRYREFYESGERVSLTYNPIYIIARKK